MTRLPLFFGLATLCACTASQSPVASSPSAAPPSASTMEAPSAAPTSAPVTLSPGLTEAMIRVRAMIGDCNDAAIQAAFSPTFLAAVPPDQVKTVFARAKSHLGACNDLQPTNVKGDTIAQVRLNCDSGSEIVSIQINPSPPHLIEGLVLHAAAP